MGRAKRIALVPAYQPDGAFLTVVEEAEAAGFAVVAVNDGSDPATAPLFEAASKHATVLNHEVNQGKGQAIKTGLAYIREHASPAAVVVTVDADGQHGIADALKVAAAAEARPGTLVVGSRRLCGKVPLRSRLGNAAARLVFQLATGRRVYDTQSGLRAFSAGMASELAAIPGERYEYEMNVLLTLAKAGSPIKEIGIETIYLRNNESSHFSTVHDTLLIVRELALFSASSLTCFALDYGLYTALGFLAEGLPGALAVAVPNVFARLVSASVNFTLNRRIVFDGNEDWVRPAARYALLAACILAGNTTALSFLVECLGWDRYVAKLACELAFFFVSWFVQRNVVFKERRQGHEQRGVPSRRIHAAQI